MSFAAVTRDQQQVRIYQFATAPLVAFAPNGHVTVCHDNSIKTFDTTIESGVQLDMRDLDISTIMYRRAVNGFGFD
eukprot:jgi/Hompol1/3019/HPOL_006297-RA